MIYEIGKKQATLVYKLLLCVLGVNFVLGVFSQPAFAAHWYTGSATIAITGDKTPNQARKEAFEQALDHAVQQAGFEISTSDALSKLEDETGYFESFAQFTSIRAKGLVTSVDTLFDARVDEPVEGSMPVLAHKVKIRASIEPTVGEYNPAFKLEMSLNRETYRSGETMEIELRPTLNCYITIFNLFSNDSLGILFPNRLRKDNYIPAGQNTMIPPQEAHWDLPVEISIGNATDHEALLAVATLQPIPFPMLKLDLQRGLMARGDALLSINKWLVEIPLDQRSEAWAFYRIMK